MTSYGKSREQKSAFVFGVLCASEQPSRPILIRDMLSDRFTVVASDLKIGSVVTVLIRNAGAVECIVRSRTEQGFEVVICGEQAPALLMAA